MKLVASDWLPLEALGRPGIRSAIDRVVQDWSSAWFVRRSLSVCNWQVAKSDTRADQDEGGWRMRASGIALSCSRRIRDRLLEWLADERFESSSLTENDRLLLQLVEQQMFEDLLRSIESALQLEQDGSEAFSVVGDGLGRLGGVIVGIADGGASGPLLALALPFGGLVPLCRDALPARSRAIQQLGSRMKGLGPVDVRMEASLGSLELSLPDLRNLAVGDVLVLDKTVRDTAEIRIAGTDVVLANGVMTQREGRKALILQKST